MKKFELIIIMVCFQLGFILTGLVEITPGRQLVTPYVDAGFAGSITGLSNGINELSYITNITSGTNLLQGQEYKVCIPLTSACTSPITIPALSMFKMITAPFSIAWSIFVLLVMVIAYSTIFAGAFYAVILISLLPPNTQTAAFAYAVGGILGTIQTIILLIEILKAISPNSDAEK